MTEVYLKKIRQDECPSCGKALRQPQTEQGLSVGEIGLVYASAIKAVAEQQTDALKIAREIPAAALDALRNGQKQIDADGEMVGVSRRALDEVLAALKESK
jgi:hypothetical protein